MEAPTLSRVMNILAKFVPSKISAKLRGQVRRSLVLSARGVEIAGKLEAARWAANWAPLRSAPLRPDVECDHIVNTSRAAKDL